MGQVAATAFLIPALAALIGALAALGANWLLTRHRRFETRRDLLSALKAEILALMEWVDTEEVRGGYAQMLGMAKRCTEPTCDQEERVQLLRLLESVQVSYRERYFQVFDSNCGSLGAIEGPLVSSIVRVYAAAKVYADFACKPVLFDLSSIPTLEGQAEAVLTSYSLLIARHCTAVDLARGLLPQLDLALSLDFYDWLGGKHAQP